MNDKELLVLAAKSVGLLNKGTCIDINDNFTGLLVNSRNGERKYKWNPLIDDGDTFRLMVNLRLLITDNSEYVYDVRDENGKRLTIFENILADSWRRAIVRAAAEIGKGFQPFPSVEEIRAMSGIEPSE